MRSGAARLPNLSPDATRKPARTEEEMAMRRLRPHSKGTLLYHPT